MSKGSVGKSLKGYQTNKATTKADFKTLFTSVIQQGFALDNVTITNATIYGGTLDDMDIGSIQPASGTFTNVAVGNEDGTGGEFVAYGSKPGDKLFWNPETSMFQIDGQLAVRDATTLGNIRIMGNDINAVNTDGEINLIPNSSKAAVNIAGSLIQTAVGAVKFEQATSFSTVSVKDASVRSVEGAVTVTAGNNVEVTALDGKLDLLASTKVQFRVDVPLTFLNDIVPPPVRGYQPPQLVATSKDALVFTASDIIFDDPVLILRSKRGHFADSGILSEYTVGNTVKQAFFGFQKDTVDLTWIPTATLNIDPVTGEKTVTGERGTLHMNQIIAGRLEGDPDLFLEALRGTIYMTSPKPVVLPSGGGIAFGVDAINSGGQASIKHDTTSLDLTIRALRDIILAGRNVVLPDKVPLVFSDMTTKIERTVEGLVIEATPPKSIVFKGNVVLPPDFKFSFGTNTVSTSATGGLALTSSENIALSAAQTVRIQSIQGSISLYAKETVKIPDDVLLQIGDVSQVGLLGHQGRLNVQSVQDIVLTPQSGRIRSSAVSFIMPDRCEVTFGSNGAVSTLGANGDLMIQSDKASVQIRSLFQAINLTAEAGPIRIQALLDIIASTAAAIKFTAATGAAITATQNDAKLTALTGAVILTAGTSGSFIVKDMLTLASVQGNVIANANQGSIILNSDTAAINAAHNVTLQSSLSSVDVRAETTLALTTSTGKITVKGASGVEIRAEDANLDLVSAKGRVLVSGATGVSALATSGTALIQASAGSVSLTAGNGLVDVSATSGVKIGTATGNITADTAKGNITFNTMDGFLKLANAKGDINLNSLNGNVRLEASAAIGIVAGSGLGLITDRGNIVVESAQGSVTVLSSRDVTVATSQGKIDVTSAQDLDLTSTHGQIAVASVHDINLTSSQGKVVFNANQDVTVTSLQGNLSFTSSHGDVDLTSNEGRAQIIAQAVRLAATDIGGISLLAAKGDVTFSSELGKISTYGQSGVEVAAATGDVRLTAANGNLIGTVGGKQTYSATNGFSFVSEGGGIEIGVKGNVALKSQTGNVTVDSSIGTLNILAKSVTTTSNGNVSVVTATGDVSLHAAKGSLTFTTSDGDVLLSANKTTTVQGTSVALNAAEKVSVPLGVPLTFGGNSRIYESPFDGKLHISDVEGVVIDRNVHINGDITVVGESSRIVATVTTFHDGLITLAPDAPVIDKSDRGFEFLYHTAAGAERWGMMGFSQHSYRFQLVLEGINNRETYAINQLGDLELRSLIARESVLVPKIETQLVSAGGTNDLQISGKVISILPADKLTLPSNVPFQFGLSSLTEKEEGLQISSKSVNFVQGSVNVGSTQLTTQSATGSFSINTASSSTSAAPEIFLAAPVVIPKVLYFGSATSTSTYSASLQFANGKDLKVTSAGQFAVDSNTTSLISTGGATTITAAAGEVDISGKTGVLVTSDKFVKVIAQDGMSVTSTGGFFTVASSTASITALQDLILSSQKSTSISSGGFGSITSVSDMRIESTAGMLDLVSLKKVAISSGGAVTVDSVSDISLISPKDILVTGNRLVSLTSAEIALASTGYLSLKSQDIALISSRDISLVSDRDTFLNSERAVKLHGGDNVQLVSDGSVEITGETALTVSSNGTMSFTAVGTMNMTADDKLVISASDQLNIASQGPVAIHSNTSLDLASQNDTTVSAAGRVVISGEQQVLLDSEHRIDIKSRDSIDIAADSQVKIEAREDISLVSTGSINATSTDAIDLNATQSVIIASGGAVSLTSDGTLGLQGHDIEMKADDVISLTGNVLQGNIRSDVDLQAGGNVSAVIDKKFSILAAETAKVSSQNELLLESKSASVSLKANTGVALTTLQQDVVVRADEGSIYLESDTVVKRNLQVGPVLLESGFPAATDNTNLAQLTISNNPDPTGLVDVLIHGYISGDCTWRGNPIPSSHGGTGHFGAWKPRSIVFVDELTNLADRPDELCWNSTIQSMGVRTSVTNAEAALSIGSGHLDILGDNAYLRHYSEGVLAWTSGTMDELSSSSSSSSLYAICSHVNGSSAPVPALIANATGQVGFGVSAESMRTLTREAGLLHLSGDLSFSFAVGTASIRWDTDTQLTGDVANGYLTLGGRSKTIVTSRLAVKNGIQFNDDVSVPASDASLTITGDDVKGGLTVAAPSRVNLTSPHVIHSERICFAHGANDSCTTYFQCESQPRSGGDDGEGGGRDLAFVNTGGDILLAPKAAVSLANNASLVFPNAGSIASSIGSSGSTSSLSITSITGTVFHPGTSGHVTIADSGSLVLQGDSTSSSASLGMDSAGHFAVNTQPNVGIKLVTDAFVSLPDNTPLIFGDNQTGKIISDGDSLFIHSSDLITLDSNNVVVTGNFVVKKTSTFTVESETDFDSGVINLGGGSVSNIIDIRAGSESNRTLITVATPHKLVVGDHITVSDTIPNVDGQYTVLSVPTDDSFIVSTSFPGIPPGATVQGTVRAKATENTNSDIGVVINWHTGITAGTAQARTGFFGFDRSTGRFTFLPIATRTGDTFTGAPGDIQVGAIYSGAINAGSGDITTGGSIISTHLSAQDLVSPLDTGTQRVSGRNFVITGGSIDATPVGILQPSQGKFTYLEVTDGLIVRNGNVVANFNADLLDGKHAVDFLLRDGSQPLTGDWNAGPFAVTAGGLAALDLTETAVPFVGTNGRLVADASTISMKDSVLTVKKVSAFTSTGNVNLDGHIIRNGSLENANIVNATMRNSNIHLSNITISKDFTLDITDGDVRFRDRQISGNVISGGVADTDITGTADLVRDGVYGRDFNDKNTILKADTAGHPVAMVVPSGTFVGRLSATNGNDGDDSETTSIQALTTSQAMNMLNAVSRDTLDKDNSILKADTAGNPVALQVPVSTLIGRSADGPVRPLQPQEVKDLLELEPITTAAIYREGALLRSGRSEAYPEGGSMTGLLLTSSERFHVSTGQTPKSLNVDVETSHVICDYLRTGGRVARCKLGPGYADGHRKLIMLSRLADHAFLQVSCNLVAAGTPDPCGFVFYLSGQTAMLQWDAYIARWFIIGGSGAQVVTPDDLDDPGFLDFLSSRTT